MTGNSSLQSQEALVIQKYLSTKQVLIIDPSATARTGLFKIFQDLGSTTNHIILANTYNQGEALIASNKPHVVVAEYEIGKKCGLDLLQVQRKHRSAETKDTIFIILTGNTSQTAVAKAAEEDIDAYIIKPYTIENVRKILIRTAVSKLKPSPYLLAIEEGKKLLAEGNFKGAEVQFTKATELEKEPALAYYYLGQSKYLQKIVEEAKGKYENGLYFNRIHYKCLVGLYELFMEQKDHKKAYDVVRKISQYFPANPKRLTEVLQLAILTGQYEDLEKYYSIFINIDERNEVLTRYVCAALIICGKYYLTKKIVNSRAIDLFQKATASSQGRNSVLKEIILSLVDFNLINESKSFLARFHPKEHQSSDFLLCQFLINSKDKVSRSIVMDQGRVLLSKGVVNPQVFTVLIQISVESNLIHAAEGLVMDACKHYPDKKSLFEELLKPKKPTPAK